MITVITPSIRKEMLPIVEKCLIRQTFRDFEWLIGSPVVPNNSAIWKFQEPEGIKHTEARYKLYGYGMLTHNPFSARWIKDPPKRDGDYYSLNASWNAMFKQARGKLIVSIVDGLWFPPDTLEKLWIHYQNNPMACIGGVGNQYDRIENGKPEHLVWTDPRITGKGFYEISPMDMEWCIASIPLKALKEVNYIDPIWDRFSAISEKHTNMKMSKKEYKFFLDESIEYRAIKHDRISPEWDKKYQEGCKYFQSLTF